MQRKFIKILKVVIIVYCLIGIALFYLQDKFLFHPEPVAEDFNYSFKGRTEEKFIVVNQFEKVHLVKFFADTPSRGLIIYFHGNMKNISYYAESAADLTSQGFDVWMADYPGFGKTTGKLTEERMYKHAMLVRKLAESNYDADKIIIYGRSLGTAVATYVAANSENRGLILEAPYSSIPSLFSIYAFIYPVNRMSNFKLPTKKFLKDVKEPVLIFHGTEDRTIPISESEKLEDVLKPGDVLVKIEGGKHNDLGSARQYREKLRDWLIGSRH